VAEVYRYRAAVDGRTRALLEGAGDDVLRRVRSLIVLGLNHEQQHQELILTDIKHAFACNPLRPAYIPESAQASGGRQPPGAGSQQGADAPRSPGSRGGAARFVEFAGGLREIGHDGAGFAFDNESPRHRVYVAPYRLADRLVTNGEFLSFINGGGYERPEFWLSDGWNARGAQGWTGPLYWERARDRWRVMTLAGMRDLDVNEPVCHVSFYEADAYARWAGARLPTEAEWELAGAEVPVEGNLAESGRLHPAPCHARIDGCPAQLFGDVWEWTASPYIAYPGYRTAAGALGEYNGKFMCNQMVLRGGSCCTPRSHVRATYRNFFPPDARWQFSGVRLAQDG
jgi:ergothioneine biosynthesis protein EgtB